MIISAVFLLLIFIIGLISRRLERTVITGPMIFTIAGMLLFFAAPVIVEKERHTETILLISEIALVLVLFTDATRIGLRAVTKGEKLPARLLGIGMPLTIIVGTITGKLLFTGLTIWEAAILATVLAPTDAGLGQVVVNSRLVPVRIRQALNVEAGFNDGLSMPFLMLFISVALVSHPLQNPDWLIFTMKQVVFGVLVGLLFGWVGGWLMGKAEQRGWMAESLGQLSLLSLAFLAWGSAGQIGGNGFIAAFVAGLAVKRGFEDAGDQAKEFSEAWGQILVAFMFFIFGMIAASRLGNFGAKVVLYAILSLTLVRMLPVAIAMIRTQLKPATLVFMGWFGPRGLASIVLGLVYLEQEAALPGEKLIMLAIIVTVLLSIFAHGVSASPGIKLYARQIEGLPDDAPEYREVVELPTR
ncbi:MAG TPA: cation:proton antiporter [Anaerolineales bacterium]|nr:cation:proton antiporter [Anaerolineales bacterium]